MSAYWLNLNINKKSTEKMTDWDIYVRFRDKYKTDSDSPRTAK